MSQQKGLALLQSLSDAVAELAERASKSVVNVGNGHRSGTGLVWSKDGHIVTANHVVGRAESMSVTLGDGTELEAKVVGRDFDNDVALLKVESNGLAPFEVADAKSLRAGQFVFALANAFGQQASVTSGIVTSPSRDIRGWWGVEIENAVITDAQLNPGYSGGPLVDAAGNLVGMNVAYYASRGIAISVGTLKRSVETLAKDGKIRRAYLGIVTEPIELPSEVAERSEVGQEVALLVRAVEDGTAARAAGLSIGDLILKFGDVSIADTGELRRLLAADAIGVPTSLWILRGGNLTELKVTPGEAQ